MGLTFLDVVRDIGCWGGSGGASSGDASKRATKSLKDAFLDLRVFAAAGINNCGPPLEFLDPRRAMDSPERFEEEPDCPCPP